MSAYLKRHPLFFAAALALGLALAAYAAPVAVRLPVFQDIPPFSTWTDAKVLEANVAETYTVPTGCYLLVFNAPGGFWVRKGGTAAIPAADVTDGTAPVYNPASRLVTPGDQLSFIADDAVKISLQCHTFTGE